MAIVITRQPTNVLGVAVGDTITFSVEATGVATYQWQYKSLEGQYWSSLPWTGNTTASVTGTANANNILFLYRCKLTDDAGNIVYTNEVRVNAEEETALEITKQPQNVTALVGGNAVFTVEAAGTGLTYQWQYKNPAVTTEWAYSSAADAQTATLTIAAETHRNGYQYRCVIRDASSNQVISDVVTLTVATSGLVDYDTIKSVADQIRALIGSTATMTPSAMDDNIGTAITAVESAKTAIRNKGVSVPTDADVIDLATYIAKIVVGTTGYQVKKGSYSLASLSSSVTITHGLGKTPAYAVILYDGASLEASSSSVLIVKGTSTADGYEKYGNMVMPIDATVTLTSSQVTFTPVDANFAAATYYYIVWG